MLGYTQGMEHLYSNYFSPTDPLMGFPSALGSLMGMGFPPVQHNPVQPANGKDIKAGDTGANQTAQHKEATNQQKVSPTPTSNRRKRTVYSPSDLAQLEQYFRANMYPDIHQREELAGQMGLPESRIQVWFQNRRSKAKRQGSRSTKPAAMGDYYNSPPMYNPAPTANGTIPHQHPMAFPQQQVQPIMDLQQNYSHLPQDLLSYPESPWAAPSQRLPVHPTASSTYPQSDLPGKPITSHSTKGMSPGKETERDLGGRQSQVSVHSNLMLDFPPNKTITPEMNTIIPQIPGATGWSSQGGTNAYPTWGALPGAGWGPYGPVSPASDSGISDACTESVSDWEENLLKSLF
ncbi:hypothetical protein XENTR_v10013207 [Xenopus tropicalis]|nr:hypothetical protein XENTR_v10013207 [Xenopus tropicalis]